MNAVVLMEVSETDGSEILILMGLADSSRDKHALPPALRRSA